MIDARKLHNWLGCGRAFGAWVRGRIDEYGFEEGVDFLLSETGKRTGRGGANRKEYLLTLDTAKELAMVEAKPSAPSLSTGPRGSSGRTS